MHRKTIRTVRREARLKTFPTPINTILSLFLNIGRKSFRVEPDGRIGQIFHHLCRQKEVELVEGHVMPDHVHIVLNIPHFLMH